MAIGDGYTLMGVQKLASKYGGDFYYVFFKSDKDGISIRSCVYPKMRNFTKNGWDAVIKQYPGARITNLRRKKAPKGEIIDADSKPIIVWSGEKPKDEVADKGHEAPKVKAPGKAFGEEDKRQDSGLFGSSSRS